MTAPNHSIRTKRHRWSMSRWFSYAVIACVAFLIGTTNSHPERAPASEDSELTRVTGIGGVFFKSGDPSLTREWYLTHLGIAFQDWGGFSFLWQERDQPSETGYTVFGVFSDSTEYFSPSNEPYMLNFRVADLDGLVAALRDEGVEIAGEIEQHPNGKFAWILDPEGRKVELWEPVPSSEDPYLAAQD